jgi:hypothetical protein
MNYQKIYNELCKRGQNRMLETYTENHHIIPRCLGGTDSYKNLTKLTAKEHYMAHLLLTKIYPSNFKLLHALGMMSMKNSDQQRIYTSRQYAKMAEAKSTAMFLSNPSKNHGAWNKGTNIKNRKTPISKWEKMAASNRMKVNNPNANGDMNKKVTLVRSVDNSEFFEFNSLVDAEKFMSSYTGKVINHTSVYNNMKKSTPYKGYYWTYKTI